MNELKLKFGEREIVLTKVAGLYWSGSIGLDEFDGEWGAVIHSPIHAFTDWFPSPQAALDALAEKVRGHIRELQALFVGPPRKTRVIPCVVNEGDFIIEVLLGGEWEHGGAVCTHAPGLAKYKLGCYHASEAPILCDTLDECEKIVAEAYR